ncbi:hypothetical protein M011DRAFT_303260 [Sporormia fimetaria CBS 119925]|uniref:Uncharacterized protein n=1 Tax=Sporormia fimetaria CBS 119925 TaxID=1340428 RepID=A0A6A6VIB7_9PLEO|nr:hypothetical protein M011DRAFT_303260 [Sporormia fimetaria CBS 119925]
MEEVLKHPTAAELDDYAEYKRLKRIYREERRKVGTSKKDQPTSSKEAPVVAAGQPITSQLRALPKPIPPPTPLRVATSAEEVSVFGQRRPQIDTPASVESPFLAGAGSHFSPYPSGIAIEPSTVSSHSPSLSLSSGQKGPALRPPTLGKQSTHSHKDEIREVAPWIDYELELIAETPTLSPRVETTPTDSLPPGPLSKAKARRQSAGQSPGPTLMVRSSSHDTGRLTARSHDDRSLKPGYGRGTGPQGLKKAISRSRNPLVKLFGGADGCEEADVGHPEPSAQSINWTFQPESSKRRLRTSSSDNRSRPLSPIPVRPISPLGSLITARPHRPHIFDATTDSPSAAQVAPSPEKSSAPAQALSLLRLSVPMSLQDFIGLNRRQRPREDVSTILPTLDALSRQQKAADVPASRHSTENSSY